MTNSENYTQKQVVSLIQARMSSKRLPGKVLMSLGETTVIESIISKANQFSDQVIVCTSDDPSDEILYNYCQHLGVLCFRGPLDDVFHRYKLALVNNKTLRTR